ncbi:hypothetical protein [Geoalkalibacter sp.]|uniref:hypothetical protein n=1 Tax=Geoalkalibacter sp. TaxID=3041440 RepID=UPI00272E6C2E|nr:hypothetical protein [Geoalkalibacter sp.]
MKTRRFHPRTDALVCPAGLIGPVELARLQAALGAAIGEALGVLRAEFGGMVDYYDLPRRLALWQQASRPDGWQTTAAALGAVDLFLARCSPPRAAAFPAWPEFLRERLLADLVASSARLVQWRAILYGVPEQWLPEDLVRRSLHQKLACDERFVFLDLHVMLRLPTPGGKAWLGAASRREWCKIHERLAAGRPCLVELIREQSCPDLCRRETIVVYAAEPGGDDRCVLHAYHPRWGAKEFCLDVDFAAEGLHLREDVANPEKLRGFFMLDCRAQQPPLGWKGRLLRSVGIAQLQWWWRHRPTGAQSDRNLSIC